MAGVAKGSFPWRKWEVVGDLLPENHQSTVGELATAADDAVDVNPALEAYFINLGLFKMTKTALAELRRTVSTQDRPAGWGHNECRQRLDCSTGQPNPFCAVIAALRTSKPLTYI